MTATMSDTFAIRPVSDVEAVITREFDAPRDLVFQVYTDPAHIPQWWGPRSTKTIVDKLDFRVGGSYRFVHKEEDGSENGFRGEYLEIVAPERIVQTFEWEGMPGHIMTDHLEFEDLGGGRTRITNRSVATNKDDLQGMIDSGMEQGMRETYDRLEELLATLTAKTR